MKLDIDKRPCHISNAMQGNTEKHGNEDVGALDIALDGIILKRDDLEALLGAGAFEALYRTDTEIPEVRLETIEYPIRMESTFEGGQVQLWLGMADDDGEATLSFDECKVRSIALTPQAGGLTLCKLKVRTTRPDADAVAAMFDYLNTDASVDIADAKVAKAKRNKAQKSLALPEGDGNEDNGE